MFSFQAHFVIFISLAIMVICAGMLFLHRHRRRYSQEEEKQSLL